ncbi:MAG TPA: response regulator [Polyangia bacterium]|jgi:CheY-like chemotaxis protein|nr:response regulator [Polyangia bacterium]
MAHILIAEDDPDIREDLSEILRDLGYEVTTATNGAEALAALRSGPPPCLILLDLMMPVMNGWDFRHQQLADEALRGIPVIVLTGVADLQRVRMLQVAGVLTKPFKLEPLLDSIERHCRVAAG